MATVKPFSCIRPAPQRAAQVAALPYDVYSREEAKIAVQGRPYSFLNIDRAETQFPDEIDLQDPRVYQKAGELLKRWLEEGVLVEDPEPSYYIYELTMDGRTQTGIVGCSGIDDYLEGVIKKHENTRADKEQDRIFHVDATDAHTGPVFLAYRAQPKLSWLTEEIKKQPPLYDFQAEDGIGHRVWKVSGQKANQEIQETFQSVPETYIADGHHRAASAVKVGLKRRRENPGFTGEEPFNYFLSVLFPDDQLKILPYNRVVRDLNGLSQEEFLDQVRRNFQVEALGEKSFQPEEKGTFGMYLSGCWYKLTAKSHCLSQDPVKGLDVSILQDWLLDPVLGIGDPRTDRRIDFVGGIRGLSELERRADSDMQVAFSMYPTSIEELLRTADAGLLMPPKSTWFEPKLRSGLFIHRLS